MQLKKEDNVVAANVGAVKNWKGGGRIIFYITMEEYLKISKMSIENYYK